MCVHNTTINLYVCVAALFELFGACLTIITIYLTPAGGVDDAPLCPSAFLLRVTFLNFFQRLNHEVRLSVAARAWRLAKSFRYSNLCYVILMVNHDLLSVFDYVYGRGMVNIVSALAFTFSLQWTWMFVLAFIERYGWMQMRYCDKLLLLFQIARSIFSSVWVKLVCKIPPFFLRFPKHQNFKYLKVFNKQIRKLLSVHSIVNFSFVKINNIIANINQ